MKNIQLTADQQVTFDLATHLANQVRDAYARVLSLEPDPQKQSTIAIGGLLKAARMTAVAAAFAAGQPAPKDALGVAIAMLIKLHDEGRKEGLL